MNLRGRRRRRAAARNCSAERDTRVNVIPEGDISREQENVFYFLDSWEREREREQSLFGFKRSGTESLFHPAVCGAAWVGLWELPWLFLVYESTEKVSNNKGDCSKTQCSRHDEWPTPPLPRLHPLHRRLIQMFLLIFSEKPLLINGSSQLEYTELNKEIKSEIKSVFTHSSSSWLNNSHRSSTLRSL